MNSRPHVVGLTGNIGAGKSTVLAYFEQYADVWILDADKLAHQAMAPGGLAYQPIVDAFGTDVLSADGTIYRPALGKIVFASPTKLRQLEQLTHPAVLTLAKDAIEKAGNSGAKLVILEAIKLLDGGSTIQLCDEVWVVTIDPESQFERLHEQRNMDRESVQNRLDAQSTQEFKISKANHVIDNSGSLIELHNQLEKLYLQY